MTDKANAARDQAWSNARNLLRVASVLEGRLNAHQAAGAPYTLDGEDLELVLAVFATFTVEVQLRVSGVVYD